MKRMRRSIVALGLALSGLVGIVPLTSEAQQDGQEQPPQLPFQVLDCSTLPGSGRFSDPLQIGVVSRTTLVRGCFPLTSGAGFNVRYFSFTLLGIPPPGAAVGSFFQLRPGQDSAVHPRLAYPGGTTIATSAQDGFWLQGEGGFTGRFLPISPLNRFGSPLPAGTWILGFEKLSSPLASLSTPSFDILIWLG